MCIRDSLTIDGMRFDEVVEAKGKSSYSYEMDMYRNIKIGCCLLYTSDAADERSSVDLGGSRIIKKKNRRITLACPVKNTSHNKTHQLLTTN